MRRLTIHLLLVIGWLCLVNAGRKITFDEEIAEVGDLDDGIISNEFGDENAGGHRHTKQTDIHDSKNPRLTHLTELDIMEVEPEEEEVGSEYDGNTPGRGKGNAKGLVSKRGERISSVWPGKRETNRDAARMSRRKRNAILSNDYRWPDGKIPYVISGSFNEDELNIIQEAMDEFETYTCLRWSERDGESDYVNIANENSGCWSYVGKIHTSFQPQTLNLVTRSVSGRMSCLTSVKTPIHEMMHAVGVYHQHTRPDRDDFVTINYDNIPTNNTDNFEKKEEDDVTVFGIPYSYNSIMHYGKTYFSNNGEDTIEALDSEYSDVIGTAPTFAYEDIELLNRMYACSASCTSDPNCPIDSYVGSDCKCYCSSDDREEPVYDCTFVCWKPDKYCQCAGLEDACDTIPNSHCDSDFGGACACDDGFVNHNDACIEISSITCDSIESDCKCSMNDGACDGLPNSECDGETNSCLCTDGTKNEQGSCVSIDSIACDEADKVCYCFDKGDDACSSVDNSACDSESGACVCSEDFYTSGDMCIATPDCSTVAAGCFCSKQGSDACDLLSNSLCNADSNACECDMSAFREEGGVCVDAYSYTSDGSSVYPFVDSPTSTTYFYPVEGTDTNKFDVEANGFFLEASGTGGSDKAAIQTGLIEKAGKWCLKFAVRLNNARIKSMYSGNGIAFYSYSIYTPTKMTYFYSRTLTITTTGKIQFRVQAEPYEKERAWAAAIDPVKVYLC